MKRDQCLYPGIMLDSFRNITTASMSIPLGVFLDGAETTLVRVGVSFSGVVGLPKLVDMGLYNYSFAEKVAKHIFEPSPTMTAKWMDATRTGPYSDLFPNMVQGQWHRTMHGHSLDNIATVIKDPNLRVVDFGNHLMTDVVTKNGIPLPFSKEIIQNISAITGIAPSNIAPWVSMNIIDIGASVLSVWHAGSNVISVYNGTAQWGFNYALDTFGVGFAEIGTGAVTHNPFLVGAGLTDCICGGITAYDYYTQPMLFGVPIKNIFGGAAAGVALSTIFSCLEIYMRRNELSGSEKFKILGKNALQSGIFGALGAISCPVSVTVSAAYSAIQMAAAEAKNTNDYIANLPITSYVSDAWINDMASKSKTAKQTDDILGDILKIGKAAKQNGFD